MKEKTFVEEFFGGRRGRLAYFGIIIFISVLLSISTGMYAVEYNNWPSVTLLFMIATWIIGFFFLISNAVKRAHDFEKEGWWAVLLWIPIVNIYFGFYFLFKAGNKDENKYGLSK